VRQKLQHLHSGLQVGQLAQVRVCDRPRLGALGRDAELQRIQLSQDLGLHLRVLRHQVQEEGAYAAPRQSFGAVCMG
jgi:hypothetical protein